jgi:hypothetical protein
MHYEGDFFSFDSYNITSSLYEEITDGYDVFGYVSINEDAHWEYEHVEFVVVPRDLDLPGIDATFEDGTSLFKNGMIVWDMQQERLIAYDDMEPSFGSRYCGVIEGFSIADYFDLNGVTGCFVMIGE